MVSYSSTHFPLLLSSYHGLTSVEMRSFALLLIIDPVLKSLRLHLSNSYEANDGNYLNQNTIKLCPAHRHHFIVRHKQTSSSCVISLRINFSGSTEATEKAEKLPLIIQWFHRIYFALETFFEIEEVYEEWTNSTEDASKQTWKWSETLRNGEHKHWSNYLKTLCWPAKSCTKEQNFFHDTSQSKRIQCR